MHAPSRDLGHAPSWPRSRRCMTLVSSLTLISACGLTFSRLSPAALPSCVNCAVSDDQCHRLFSRLWSSVLCWWNKTLATLRWLVYRPTYWIASNLFSTLQLGRSPVYVAQITSLTLLPVFTGFVLLAVLVYRALHGTAPRYLSDLLRRVADLPSRRRLRSATFSQLDVRPSRLVTVGDRSFASAGPKLWNSLPNDITSASSLSVFRKKLKTHLLRQSYLDVIF